MKTVLLIACSLLSLQVFADWETIKGNGNLKTEARPMQGYTGVNLQGAMNVVLHYGTSDKITVEADENLLPYIETVVENDRLVVKTKGRVNLKSMHKLIVHATLTRLTSLVVSGSGNLTGDGAFSHSGKTEIKLSGSGNIMLNADSFSELDIAVSGSGNMRLKGNESNNITAAVSGSGNIDCGEFKTNDVFARVSGSGGIKVYANASIDAKVSGSGNVYYKGSAPRITSKTSGSGRVVKV